jgi:2-oxo-4-hydroxy-4-carboxy-5-ureidoimidazoline decarboxylase
MNPVLARWNTLSAEAAAREILSCCGSQAWATAVVARRPIADEKQLIDAANSVWSGLLEADWQQAFDSHPRIGQGHAASATAKSLQWSSREQSTAAVDDKAKRALVEANERYEQHFGRIFIVCASGKTSQQILGILESRMHNDAATELREAAEQQRQITQLRLRRWLESN